VVTDRFGSGVAPRRRPRARTIHPKLPAIRRPALTYRPRGIREIPVPAIPYPGLEPRSPQAGTLPERMVLTWLKANAARWGIAFKTQTPELGFDVGLPGGARVDFEIIYPYRMFWRVQGLYWHRLSAGVVGRDFSQRLQLESFGTVVDLWETDVLRDVDSVCRDALAGLQRPEPETGYLPYYPRG
jgi:hypothetical protein